MSTSGDLLTLTGSALNIARREMTATGSTLKVAGCELTVTLALIDVYDLMTFLPGGHPSP